MSSGFSVSTRSALRRADSLEQMRAAVQDDLREHQARLKRTERKLNEHESGPERATWDAKRVRHRRSIDRLRAQLKDLDAERSTLHDTLDEAFHPFWGSVFKAGNEVSSFGSQVEQYAGLYTSRATNLAQYSPNALLPEPKAPDAARGRVILRGSDAPVWLRRALPWMLGRVVGGLAGGFGLSYTARPPPPVILPAAAVASLCLGGAFAPGFALRARATAHVLGDMLPLQRRPLSRYLQPTPRKTAAVQCQLKEKNPATPTYRIGRGVSCRRASISFSRAPSSSRSWPSAVWLPCRSSFRDWRSLWWPVACGRRFACWRSSSPW